MSQAGDWRSRVAEIAAEEEDENTELHDLTAAALVADPSPVLIIVHPGDASGEPGIEDALESMQVTLRQRAKDCRVIVLHRFSSVYMDPDHEYAVGESLTCQDWFEVVAELCDGPDTIQFYGDGLADFCARIADLLCEAREVLVSGLWGDEEDGCAATVAGT